MPHCTNTLTELDIPFITHECNDRFITNITNGTKIGYKYFKFEGRYKISIMVKGDAVGQLVLSINQNKTATIEICNSKEWKEFSTEFEADEVASLNFLYEGDGKMDLLMFNLRKID